MIPIDVWRRRSILKQDARPLCRVFFYVVTATPSYRFADPMPAHSTVAALFPARKRLPFVLSRMKTEIRSCYRG